MNRVAGAPSFGRRRSVGRQPPLSAIKSDDKMLGRAESGGGLRAATKQPALLLPLGGTDRHEKLLNLFLGDGVGRTKHVIIAA